MEKKTKRKVNRTEKKTRQNVNKTNVVIIIIRALLLLTFVGALLLGLRVAFSTTDIAADTYFISSFTALLSLGITYIPDFLNHKDIMVVPAAMQTFFTIFTLLAMFFGEILGFYSRFEWWDSMLHLSSGIMFGMVGYMLFVSLNRDSGIRRKLNPMSVMLFCFCFSIACGAMWEIFEFAGDSLLGMNMQRWKNTYTAEEWASMQNVTNFSNPGLVDTMKDIINDTIGTLASLVIILPMIKRDNKYVKPPITIDDLAEEEQKIFAEILARHDEHEKETQSTA